MYVNINGKGEIKSKCDLTNSSFNCKLGQLTDYKFLLFVL